MAKRNRRSQQTRLTGLGVELAASVVGLALLGYWIDRHYETGPWGLVIGAGLGIIGGLYNFVRVAMKASRRARGGEAGGRESE